MQPRMDCYNMSLYIDRMFNKLYYGEDKQNSSTTEISKILILEINMYQIMQTDYNLEKVLKEWNCIIRRL